MRPRFPVAVHLLFLQQDMILLLRRFNTGWQDGNYSVPAGHVEFGETVIAAAIREAAEEVGVCLQPDDLEIVHVMQRRSDEERIDFFLLVKAWAETPYNHEPDKCDDIHWYSQDDLPDNLIPYVRQALTHYRAKVPFSLFGWS